VHRYQAGPSLTAGLTPYLSHGRNIPMGHKYSYSISYNLITVKAPCEATLTSPTLLLIRWCSIDAAISQRAVKSVGDQRSTEHAEKRKLIEIVL
jgi:hypothetical protein